MQPKGKQPHVVFVVVNWNQRQLTLDCLASLQRQDYGNFEVVLVDNGSEDDSVRAVKAAYPEVAVKENGANLGIAAANNVGISFALDRHADYVFLLNNDTVVDRAMLKTLVDAAESSSTIGSTGPTMLYFDLPTTIWCAGNRVDWSTGSTYRLRAGAALSSVAGLGHADVDFITSCAVCIKSDVFRHVGLMDDAYFIYYDETDWFARAAAMGWRNVYVPQARMWHKVSAAMGTASPATDYYMVRNVLRFLVRNSRGPRKLVALCYAVARNLVAIAAYTANPHGGRRIPNRDARVLGLRDAVIGRYGKMGMDVAAVCYGEHD